MRMDGILSQWENNECTSVKRERDRKRDRDREFKTKMALG